ncbi:MAG: DUF4160 domain-containing protein [Microvirga sp.]
MPRVAFVDSIRIEFYPNEHPPPHFHAVYAEHRAAFYISVSRFEMDFSQNRRSEPCASGLRRAEYLC